MKQTRWPMLLIVITAMVSVSMFFYLVAAQVVSNDHKLFAAADAHQAAKLAQQCGRRGTLWMQPQTRQYACIYRNPDGRSMLRAIEPTV